MRGNILSQGHLDLCVILIQLPQSLFYSVSSSSFLEDWYGDWVFATLLQVCASILINGEDNPTHRQQGWKLAGEGKVTKMEMANREHSVTKPTRNRSQEKITTKCI